jgi:hypothetical protein
MYTTKKDIIQIGIYHGHGGTGITERNEWTQKQKTLFGPTPLCARQEK